MNVTFEIMSYLIFDSYFYIINPNLIFFGSDKYDRKIIFKDEFQ